MKAARIIKPKEPLRIEELNTPNPKGNQVLVRVKASGVCHSDIHLWEGGYAGPRDTFMRVEDRGVKFPLTPGHEIAGIVERIGDDVAGISEGDEVLVYPWIGDGSCPACVVGEENLCDKPRSLGIFQDGGYAEYVLVPHQKYLINIKGLEPEQAASLACSALTAYTALKNSMVRAQELLVIVGAGGLGLIAVQLARALVGSNIVVIDLDDKRLDEARRLGADVVINAKSRDVVKEVKDITNGLGADAVIDFVNSSSTVVKDIDMLRKRGRLILVGLFGGAVELNLPLIPLRAFKIIGSYTGKYADLVELVALAKRGIVKSIVAKRFKLDEANDAITQLKEGKIIGRAIISP